MKKGFTLTEGAMHVANWKGFHKVAFTLAEVLITLGIIGVVAAMTLPSVIANYREKETVTKLKKLNSTFQNAYNLLIQDEFGGVDASGWGDISQDEFVKVFTKYLQVSKVCSVGQAQGCFGDIKYANLGGVANQLYFDPLSAFVLNDGSAVAIGWINGNNPEHVALTGDYGQLFVDINGKKSPNVLGRDVFSFVIRKDKLIARGSLYDPKSENNIYDKGGYCDKNYKGIGHNGLGCTAWVIYMENMDYLK